jgi:hypothetical protein
MLAEEYQRMEMKMKLTAVILLLVLALSQIACTTAGDVAPRHYEDWKPTAEMCRAGYQLFVDRISVLPTSELPFNELTYWSTRMAPCEYKDIQHSNDYRASMSNIDGGHNIKMAQFLMGHGYFEKFVAEDKKFSDAMMAEKNMRPVN